MELDRLAVLVEPQRRRVYESLQAAPEPATVGELADAAGASRTLTTFHLNRLVEAGLAAVLPAEPVARRRGRPSQRYRATGDEVSASVPARRYDLVAEVLLDAAAEQQPGEPFAQAAARAARSRGEQLGRDEPAAARSGALRRVERLLERLGYRPTRRRGELVLRNCPFSRLRDPHLQLVCHINAALAEGYLNGTGASDQLEAELRPTAGCCCVVVRPR